MDLHVFLLADTALDEHLEGLLAMVALELDNVDTAVLVLDNAAVAGKVFFEDFEDLFGINIFRETLDGGQSFAAITLMKTYI